MCKHFPSRNQELVALCVACAAAISFFGGVVLPNATRLRHGFIAYDTLAHLARIGQADARIYDAAWFRTQSAPSAHGAREQCFAAARAAARSRAARAVGIAALVWRAAAWGAARVQ